MLISRSEAVSPQVDKPLMCLTLTHGQCDARPTVTFPAARHHRHLTASKLYCLVTEAHVCDVVNTCPQVLCESGTVEIRIRDLLIRKSNALATTLLWATTLTPNLSLILSLTV